MRNKALVGLGIIIILVVIAALAAPEFIDVNHYRPQIEAKLRDRLNRNVSLGPMRLSLIPLAFRVDNVRIDEDQTAAPMGQHGLGESFGMTNTGQPARPNNGSLTMRGAQGQGSDD